MTVFKFLVLTGFCFLGLISAHGQTKRNKDSILTHIKEVFRQTNEYKNYNTITIDDAEKFLGHGTDNGGSLIGYFKTDTLKKISEWVGLSNKVIQNEYYFEKGKLVFVYSTESRYRYNPNTQEFDYTKLDRVFQGRYYFNNDKLVDTLLSDKQHIDTKQEDAADLLVSSSDYLKLLNTKRK